MLRNTTVLQRNPALFDLLVKVLVFYSPTPSFRKLLSTWQDIGVSCKLQSSLSF